MQPSERLRFLLFVTLVMSVGVLAAGVLVRMLLERLGRLTPVNSRRQVWYRRIILGLATVEGCCVAYGYLVEPYWPEVTHVRITSPKLPPGSRPIRIVHISDLHSDPRPRLEKRLPGLIRDERPDLIVFTGDSINSPEGLPVFKSCLRSIAAIAPTYVVRGNWDTWFWSGLDLFGGTGAHELRGDVIRMEVRGIPLSIAGARAEGQNGLRRVLGAGGPDEFRVFLIHYPDEIMEASRHKVDLYCAGHTHGGQIALPFYGALVTLSKFGKRFEAGLYRVGETWLYVNRGIGMEGGRAPRVRFCARPEVTVIDVHHGRPR